MLRQPAVAGYFYPAEKIKLQQELSGLIPERQKSDAKAIAVPHAGYVYSGHVAGEVYASVNLPDSFIILCPNHTGEGSDFDLWPRGEWVTPLGSARVDEQLSAALLERFPWTEKNGRAHLREHSLEVQLPFLQVLKNDFSFVALSIRQFHYPLLEELGHAIAQVIQTSNRDVLIIASTDMTHYERQESANRKDRLAIEQMERLDPRGLYDTVQRNDISMCGYLPTTAALIAARDLGATSGILKKYATSGDITGDYGQVVGYAGMIFF